MSHTKCYWIPGALHFLDVVVVRDGLHRGLFTGATLEEIRRTNPDVTIIDEEDFNDRLPELARSEVEEITETEFNVARAAAMPAGYSRGLHSASFHHAFVPGVSRYFARFRFDELRFFRFREKTGMTHEDIYFHVMNALETNDVQRITIEQHLANITSKSKDIR